MCLNHKLLSGWNILIPIPVWRRNLINCMRKIQFVHFNTLIACTLKHKTQYNPASMFFWTLLNPKTLQLDSESDTWYFVGELLIRRSIHCRLCLRSAVWCSTGFKEQLIMTLWTHLWNKQMKDRELHIWVDLDWRLQGWMYKSISPLYCNVVQIPLVSNPVAPFFSSVNISQKIQLFPVRFNRFP